MSKCKEHDYITDFVPKLTGLDSADKAELALFNAGSGFKAFNDYISSDDVQEDSEAGRGTTHLIWDIISDSHRELVAYFTLCVNVIPYDDGIYADPQICDYPSIPVLEIKMFAVSEKYQDVFFKKDGVDMPISAWCLRSIISYADIISRRIAGVKALLLHSVPTAEQFYYTNGFRFTPTSARLLYSVDSDFKAMWLPIRECNIPYDA